MNPILWIVTGIIICFLVVPAKYVQKQTYARNWMKRIPSSDVKQWVNMTIKGSSKVPVKVHTRCGTFKMVPVNATIHHMEIIPVLDDDPTYPVLVITRNKMVEYINRSFNGTIFKGRFHVSVEPHAVATRWTVSDDMTTTVLSEKCVLHTDNHKFNDDVVNIIICPGKSADFRCKNTLEFFRDINVRVHVLYYESHTYARHTEKYPDCSFPSGSFDLSIRDLHKAVQITNSTFLLGYSLGGLIAALYATRYPKQKIKLILIAPLLSFDKTQAHGLECMSGLVALAVAKLTAKKMDDIRCVPYNLKKTPKLNFGHYMQDVFPISVNVQQDAKRDIVSFTFLEAARNAMREVRSNIIQQEGIAILPRLDRVVSSSASMRILASSRSIQTKEVEESHMIWPCPQNKDSLNILKLIQEFMKQ